VLIVPQMLAARYERNGSAHDVLQVVDLEAPQPGPGEVLVRMVFSGVNPTDWKARAGSRRPSGSFQVPNQDGSGIIEAVGDGVDPGRVGERVWLFFAAWQRPWGTAAEYTVVPADQAARLPDHASFELGASLGIPAMTAHRCLLADGPIKGKAVLVAGGAGAVGRSAIQLARWLGAANVVATVSSEHKAAIARDAGADAVIDYTAADALERVREAVGDGVDRIVEVSLGANLELDLAAAATHCVVATYADDGPDPLLSPLTLMRLNLVLRFVLIYTMPRDAVDAAVADLTEALEDGALTEPQLHRFPLERTADAHDAVETGAVGKVLIEVGRTPAYPPAVTMPKTARG
jgi:NADPH:quinone reductase